MVQRRAAVFIPMLAVASGIGLLQATALAATGRTVVLKDIAFTPERLVVRPGTTVTWRWADGDTRHNVRSVGTRRFTGSALKPTGSHRVTFRRGGTYRYVCSVHPGMDGRVIVR